MAESPGHAVLSLLVHGSLHVVDHGEAADGLQEVMVRPVGTAGPGGAICSLTYPSHIVLGPPKYGTEGRLRSKDLPLFSSGNLGLGLDEAR